MATAAEGAAQVAEEQQEAQVSEQVQTAQAEIEMQSSMVNSGAQLSNALADQMKSAAK